MVYERMYSTEPEPVPEREEGYYWVKDKDHDPFVAYYGPEYVNDQLLVNGKITGKQILCSYDWSLGYDAEDMGDVLDEDTLEVLSDRITEPL